jgi:hypothetical protein
MLALADYASADLSTFVGQARLAAETELGERTVRRIIASLVSAGILRRELRYGNARGRRTNQLVLTAAAIADLPASLASRSAPISRPPGTPLPANGTPPTGQALADEPLVEPDVTDEPGYGDRRRPIPGRAEERLFTQALPIRVLPGGRYTYLGPQRNLREFDTDLPVEDDYPESAWAND